MRPKAFRRYKQIVKKAKERHKCKRWLGREPTKEEIGKAEAVHGRFCSCRGCGNPRKLGYLTIQEVIFKSKSTESDE